MSFFILSPIYLYYLTNYYLKKLSLNTKNKLTEYNCYFIPSMLFEYNNKKIKTKKVLTF